MEMVDVESIVKVNYIFCIALPGADKQTDVLQYLMQVAGDDLLMNIIRNAESEDEYSKQYAVSIRNKSKRSLYLE